MIKLMVVVIIVAILSAVAVPLYTSHITDQRKTEATARLGAILTAAKSFYQENDRRWPVSFDEAGFYADFSPSKHFTYEQLSSTSDGEYRVRATGNGVDGVKPTMIVILSSSAGTDNPSDPKYKYPGGEFTYTGFNN